MSASSSRHFIIRGVPVSILRTYTDQYQILGRLGGAGGVNFLVSDHRGKKYILKQISNMERGFREDTILRKISELDLPNFVKRHDSFIYENIYVIVLEYIQGHDLEYYLTMQKEKGYRFRDGFCINFARWLFLTISILHKQGIVHRDIKPANIMFDQVEQKMTLIDFGYACYVASDKKDIHLSCQESPDGGTPFYTAPERLKGGLGALDRYAVDIWAAGITLYRICLLDFPFDTTTPIRESDYRATLYQRVTSFQEAPGVMTLGVAGVSESFSGPVAPGVYSQNLKTLPKILSAIIFNTLKVDSGKRLSADRIYKLLSENS